MGNIGRLAGFITQRRIADGMRKVGSNFLTFWNSSSSASFRVDLVSSIRSLSSSAATTVVSSLSSSRLPCLMIPPQVVSDGEVYKRITEAEADEEDRDNYHHFFSVAEKKVVRMWRKNKGSVRLPWQTEVLPHNQAICFGSSHGWLAYIHPRNCSLYLFNPYLSSFPYLPLPPIETLPSFASSVRRLHSSDDGANGKKIVTAYLLRNELSLISSEELSKNFFHKIALSSSPSPFFSSNDNDNGGECTAMAIQGLGLGRLAFCRIGDRAWTGLDGDGEEDWDYSYIDVVYSSKDRRFYTLTDRGRIEAWDLSDPLSPKRSLISYSSQPDGARYLVGSSGDLLLVYTHRSNCNGTICEFRVCKVDLDEGDAREVKSLRNRVLFVGHNHSVSLSATDFPGLKKNSIYFSPQPFGLRSYVDSPRSLGVFSLKDGSISSTSLEENQQPPVWVFPEEIQTITPQ